METPNWSNSCGLFLLAVANRWGQGSEGWTVTHVDVAVEPVTGGACEVRGSKCNVSVDGVTPFYSLWHMPHHTIVLLPMAEQFAKGKLRSI